MTLLDGCKNVVHGKGLLTPIEGMLWYLVSTSSSAIAQQEARCWPLPLQKSQNHELTTALAGMCTVPSIMAELEGGRMQFSIADAPISWPKQVTSTDFPAPLSPVTTFRPGASSTVSSAISAKSLHD